MIDLNLCLFNYNLFIEIISMWETTFKTINKENKIKLFRINNYNRRILVSIQYSIPFSKRAKLWWKPVAILSILPRFGSEHIGILVNFGNSLLWFMPNYP